MVPTFFHLRVDIQVPAVLPMRANPSAYQDGHTELYQVNVAAVHQHRRLSTSLSVLTNSVGQAASAQDTGLNVLVKRLVRAETGIRLSVRIACRLALIVPKTCLLPQHQHKTLSPGYISVARAPTLGTHSPHKPAPPKYPPPRRQPRASQRQELGSA